MKAANVSVVIPALNEEEPIGDVVRACLTTGLPDEVIVVDNGSTDRTAERAQAAGARVIAEPTPGYGRACAAGVRALSPETNIVVFLDGDGSDCPELMDRLVRPIQSDQYDFVIGSRTRGERERGSMNFQQVASGRAAGFLLRLLYGVKYTDMSPFRAIRRDALDQLGMKEKTYGWNLEMQMRVARAGMAHSGSAGQSSLSHGRRIESFRNATRNVRSRNAHSGNALARCRRRKISTASCVILKMAM